MIDYFAITLGVEVLIHSLRSNRQAGIGWSVNLLGDLMFVAAMLRPLAGTCYGEQVP